MGKPLYKIRTITCHCGTVVTGRLRPHQKFCSLDCYRTAPKPERKQGEYRQCKICGAAIWIVQSRLATGQTDFFCSKEHADQWSGRNKTTHTCKMCRTIFTWSPSRTESGKYNVTYCSQPCRDADPDWHAMLMAMVAKQQRLYPNRIESIGYALLDSFDIPYERQYLIGEKFCVDAFIPSLRFIIQFDGDYWHGNPAKYPELDSRQKKRVQLDQSQDAYMRTCGYTVIRIWASDLEKHLDHVRTRLQSLLTR